MSDLEIYQQSSKRYYWRVKTIVAVLALTVAAGVPLRSQSRDLTPEEARTLATLTLVPKARQLPTLSFASTKGFGARAEWFYWLEATGEMCGGCSPVLGHFAVNRKTGDVWDAVSCKRYRSRELEYLQQVLQRKIQLAASERRRLNVAPCKP